jgi:hypothetical protein
MGNATQISTSVTIISSLLGFQAISLTDYTTSALSLIAAGSKCEVGGAFFNFATDCTPNASSWTAITTATTAYLQLTPSGVAGSQTLAASYTATAPVWRNDYQGWYASVASVSRVIGSIYKYGTSRQGIKTLYVKGQDTIFDVSIDIGDWNMVAASACTVAHNLDFLSIKSFTSFIKPDAAVSTTILYPLSILTALGAVSGFVMIQGTNIMLHRENSLFFDSTNFDATSYNRGYITVTYQG